MEAKEKREHCLDVSAYLFGYRFPWHYGAANMIMTKACWECFEDNNPLGNMMCVEIIIIINYNSNNTRWWV